MKKIRLGAGSAYWGDLLEPAIELADKGNVDYLCFDHLSELTLAVLQRQKSKDPNEGYIKDIEPWLEATLPQAKKQGFKIVTNAGGANPAAAAPLVAPVRDDADRKAIDAMIRDNSRLAMNLVPAGRIRSEIQAAYRAGMVAGLLRTMPDPATIYSGEMD